MSWIWHNGGWVGETGFSVSPADRGVTLGFALFETILAVDGRPGFLSSHLERLRGSCRKFGWTVPDCDFESISKELLERNGLEEGRGRLRLTMTAGSGPVSDKRAGKDASVWMTAVRADARPAEMAVTVSPWQRNAASPLAGLKAACYAENLLALDEAKGRGFDEAIQFNTAGNLCEAATSNVFLVRDSVVMTPWLRSGCLPGVTRAFVIRWSGSRGIRCIESDLGREDLDRADEIFLTSSIRGPVPVCRLDERRFGETPVTDAVRGAWEDEICRS